MAVKKLFWEEPYCTAVEAVVTGVAGPVVTLDRTILYAFSGGQDSDSGTIAGYPVLKAEKDGKEILYTLPPEHDLYTGERVPVCIDWEKRYKLMKLHFAAELILELVYQNFDHPEKIGAHITQDKARLDFHWPGNITALFPELQRKVSEMIAADQAITSDFEDVEAERRYWEIPEFAKVACGGTHLRSTGEIGAITLKRRNVGGGKERIEIYLRPLG